MQDKIASAELAKLVGLSERQLRNLAAEGFIPRVQDGGYPFAEAIGGVVRYYREGQSSGYAQQLARLTKEKANIAGLKREAMERKLVPIDFVENLWGAVVVEMRQRIMASPLPDQARADILGDLKNIAIDHYFEGLEPEEPLVVGA